VSLATYMAPAIVVRPYFHTYTHLCTRLDITFHASTHAYLDVVCARSRMRVRLQQVLHELSSLISVHMGFAAYSVCRVCLLCMPTCGFRRDPRPQSKTRGAHSHCSTRAIVLRAFFHTDNIHTLQTCIHAFTLRVRMRV